MEDKIEKKNIWKFFKYVDWFSVKLILFSYLISTIIIISVLSNMLYFTTNIYIYISKCLRFNWAFAPINYLSKLI